MQSVLIADDHEVTRRGLREILTDKYSGIEVCEVGDAKEFREELPLRTWDLILLDVRMPGAKVLDLLQLTRALEPPPPVLILTALTEIEFVTETMRAGANGFIHKHRASDDLLEAVSIVARGGTYLHPETAMDLAKNLRDSSDPAALPHLALTKRELEVFCMIARGLAIKEIGGELGLSAKTVATYLTRIREKTGINSHVEIARYALQHQLVD